MPVRWKTLPGSHPLVVAKKKVRSKPRKRDEAILQERFFAWLSGYPEVRCVTFAIPNGGSRNIMEAASLKRQGVTSGVADIFMAIPKTKFENDSSSPHFLGTSYHGLFIELKSSRGKLSKNQKFFKENVIDYKYLTCSNLEELKHHVREHLLGTAYELGPCNHSCPICYPPKEIV